MKYYHSNQMERIGYDFYADIAERIVEGRKQKGWTQKQLADAVKIPESRICRMEQVQIRIKLHDIEMIAKGLDVTANWLMRAELDSQVGECLYLIWTERVSDLKLYMKATSKRLAFLKWEEKLNKCGVRCLEVRERAYVELVGTPVTDSEIKDKFHKLTPGDEEIKSDTHEDA